MEINKLTKEQLIYNLTYIIETSKTKEELKGRLNAFIDSFIREANLNVERGVTE